MNQLTHAAAAERRFSDRFSARKWSDLYDSETPVLREVNYRARRDLVVDYVRRVVPEGGRVLDLGCGSAPVLSLLRQSGIACIGLDYAEDMVRRSKERLRAMGLADDGVYRGDCCQTGIDDASVDVVVALGVISYVEDYSVVLREIDRILKRGGYAIISFRNQFNPVLWDPVETVKTLARAATGRRKTKPYKIGRFMDFREFRNKVEQLGFERRVFFGIGFGPIRLNRRAIFDESTSIRVSRAFEAVFRKLDWELPIRWLSDVSLWAYQKPAS